MPEGHNKGFVGEMDMRADPEIRANTPDAIKSTVSQSEMSDYLTFMVDNDLYAVQIMRVKEIIEYHGLTTVPMMPPFIRGVINLRGSVVPVVDLRVRFGNRPTDPTKKTCFVIVEVPAEKGWQEIGVVVDSVSEVLSIPGNEIEPPPTFGAKIRADFIDGMGKIDSGFVIILCVEKVLSVDELANINGFASQINNGSVLADTHL